MLVEFAFENFRSVKERQTISFLPVGRNPSQIDTGSTYEPHVVPTVGLFGPNGSGKSNTIYALRFFQNALRFSGRLESGRAIPIAPFAFDLTEHEPVCTMEMTVAVQGNLWRYGWEMSATRVVREWLFLRRPARQELQVFVRDGREIKIAKWVRGEKRTWKNVTLENQLLLSKISENDDGEITSFHKYILSSLFIVSSSGDRKLGFYTARRCDVGQNVRAVEGFLQSVGVDVDQLAVNRLDNSDEEDASNDRLGDYSFSGKIAGKEANYEVHFIRAVAEGQDIALDISDESTGNRSLFHMAGPILDSLTMGSVLVIDEIDNSLHTAVLRAIVEMWQDPSINIKGAQLLFSAHDTSVMNDGRLEKDQVYLVQKNERRVTEIFSLAEFGDVDGAAPRRREAFGKQYLSGKFGALPEFDPRKLLNALSGD